MAADAPERAAMARARRLLGLWVSSVLLLTIGVMVLTWPVAIHPARLMISTLGDGVGGIALLRYRDLLDVGVLSTRHTVLQGYPFGIDLPGASGLPQILVDGPTQLIARITGEPVLAYNLSFLVGMVATGLAMFVLVRHLVGGYWIPLLFAFAYAMSPWMVTRLGVGHAGLIHLEGPAVVVLGLIMLRRDRGGLAWATTALGFVVSAYTNSYLTPALGVIVASYLIADLATARNMARAVHRAAGLLALLALVYLPQLAWLVTHRSGIDNQFAGGRTIGDLYVYGARWFEWVTPHPQHLVAGDWTAPFLDARRHGSNLEESTLYLGIVCMALAAVAIVAGRRWRATLGFPIVFSATMILVGLFTATPPKIHPFGVGIPTPSRLIFEFFPYWRVYGRLFVVVSLATVVLAAIGARYLAERVPPGRWQIVAGAALALLLAVDTLGVRPPHMDTTPGAIFTELSALPEGARVEYPLEDPLTPATFAAMLQTRDLAHPLVNGADPATAGANLGRRLRDLSDPATVPALASLGARWLVVHSGATPPPARPDLRLVAERGGARLYAIRAGADRPVLVAPDRSWWPAEDAPSGPVQWMNGDHATLAVVNPFRVPRRIVMDLTLSAFAMPRTAILVQDSVAVAEQRIDGSTVMTATVTVPPGISELALRSKEPAQRVSDVTDSADQRVLSLQLISAETRVPATGAGKAPAATP